MLEVIYRIYQVADEETAKANLEKDLDFGIFSSTSKKAKMALKTVVVALHIVVPLLGGTIENDV